jgi:SSS family solute:Na+ symporter
MIDFIIVGIYLLSILVVGIYYTFRVKTVSDYAVANREYTTPIIVATIIATLIGGASTIGIAEQFFSVGIICYLICLAATFRDLIQARWIVPRMGDLSDVISSGALMGKYFGKSGQVITGFAVVARCIGIIGIQVCALGFLGNYLLNISYNLSAIGAGIIVIFYSSFGGIRSVTITDVIQFGILVVAIPMVCNFGLNAVGGFGPLLAALPNTHKTFFVEPSLMIKYLGLACVFLLPDLEPAILQRILMGKTLQQGQRSLIITALGIIPIFAMAGLIGLMALAIKPTLEPNLAFPFLLNDVLPIGVKGIAIAGILAVVMSTADSYLNIAGISLVHDIIGPLRKKKLTDQIELRLMQFGTLLLGAISIVGALALPNIFTLSVAALAVWKPVIFPPMLLAMTGLLKSKKLFYIGISVSISVLCLWNIFIKPLLIIDGILIASLINFLILLSPKLMNMRIFNSSLQADG